MTQNAVTTVKKQIEFISQGVQRIQQSTEQNSQAISYAGQKIDNAHDSTLEGISQILNMVHHLEGSSELDHAIQRVIGGQDTTRTMTHQQSSAIYASFDSISAQISEITFAESEDLN